MPTTSERHRLLEELRKGIRHYREKQSFNILMDLDPFDVKDLLAAAEQLLCLQQCRVDVLTNAIHHW